MPILFRTNYTNVHTLALKNFISYGDYNVIALIELYITLNHTSIYIAIYVNALKYNGMHSKSFRRIKASKKLPYIGNSVYRVVVFYIHIRSNDSYRKEPEFAI